MVLRKDISLQKLISDILEPIVQRYGVMKCSSSTKLTLSLRLYLFVLFSLGSNKRSYVPLYIQRHLAYIMIT